MVDVTFNNMTPATVPFDEKEYEVHNNDDTVKFNFEDGHSSDDLHRTGTGRAVVDHDNLRSVNVDSLDTFKLKKGCVDSRMKLRIAIITENFLPKIDGVTRTLARLLEHLQLEGHTALVLGPDSGMSSYAGHEVVGTKGIPLIGVYKGLKLNFIRPRFIRRLMDFQPDVIQFVDPIWLGAQCIPAIQYWMPDVPLLSSYHTNLAMYATLFGFSWLTPTMWNLQRYLHGCCQLTYCPSPSTARMLESQGFQHVRLWPRGVDTALFRPAARDLELRRSWGAEPELDSTGPLSRPQSPVLSTSSLPPPSYAEACSTFNLSQTKVVMLYVGRLSWEKNLRLLIESFRGLERASTDGARPACQLVFVGDGPSRPELERMCAQYGIDAIFMGYRKGEELAACYASADIFAFPSWTETFGQVVLESLASGLPVVGLRAEGVCDLVEDQHTGFLLDLDDLLPFNLSNIMPNSTKKLKPLPENPHELVNASSPTFPIAVSKYRSLLVQLATDHTLRRSMGQRASQEAAKRSWHSAMEMLVDGHREIALARRKEQDEEVGQLLSDPAHLSLTRTSTVELDVVISPSADKEETYAETTAASPRAKRLGVGRVLKLGGVFRRTGGRFKEGSISAPIRTWLVGKNLDESPRLVPVDSTPVKRIPKKIPIARIFLKLVLVSCFFYYLFYTVIDIIGWSLKASQLILH